MEKNTPVFFKKLPATEETSSNALFECELPPLPKANPCRIRWRNEIWTVDRSEVFTVHEALQETAKKYNSEIESAKAAGATTLKAIAKKLGMSETTVSKRMRLVQNHLPKTISTTQQT